MYLITVTPLKKAIGKETLSYVSKTYIEPGSAISVPIRKKESLALVHDCTAVRDEKSAIKNADYALRPLKEQVVRTIMLPEFALAARTIARTCASTTGAVLASTLPLTLLSESNYSLTTKKRTLHVEAPEPRALHAGEFERPQLYRRLAREVLATNKSCLVIAPTIARARTLFAILKRGIEEQSHLLDSSQSPKKLLETWNHVAQNEEALLVVGTPGFIAAPLKNIGSIILDTESDQSYKHKERPYVDTRDLAIEYARELGIDCHLGDDFFRVETYAHVVRGTYQQSYPFSLRTTDNVEHRLIDMNDETEKSLTNAKKPRTVRIPLISQEAAHTILANVAADRTTFVFVNRTGLAPQTVCGDCGTPITCPSCKLPAMLHESKSGTRTFACWHCQEVLPANTLCPTCGGWRLVPLGIGADAVAEDVRQLVPSASLIQIDGLHTNTRTKAQKAFAEAKEKPGSIIVGTEMALRAIDTPVESCIVASIDNRFSIPDFRMYEYTYRTLANIKERSIDPLIIQTRHPKHAVFSYFLKKSYEQFYTKELEDRNMYSYPPFSALIRLSITDSLEKVESLTNQLMRELELYNVVQYDALRPLERGKHTAHILVTVPAQSWQRVARREMEDGDEQYHELLRILRTLPQHIRIEHNPLSIL